MHKPCTSDGNSSEAPPSTSLLPCVRRTVGPVPAYPLNLPALILESMFLTVPGSRLSGSWALLAGIYLRLLGIRALRL